MGIAQPQPHYQPQERIYNEDQKPKKVENVVAAKFVISRCGNPNNIYVWAEQSVLHTALCKTLSNSHFHFNLEMFLFLLLLYLYSKLKLVSHNV